MRQDLETYRHAVAEVKGVEVSWIGIYTKGHLTSNI